MCTVVPSRYQVPMKNPWALAVSALYVDLQREKETYLHLQGGIEQWNHLLRAKPLVREEGQDLAVGQESSTGTEISASSEVYI